MKNTFAPLLLLFAAAQTVPAQPPAKLTDVYRVTFLKSAPGKAAQLGEDLKAAGAKGPMPGHFLLLRHSSGDDWDYVVIEHNGPKMTVDTAPPPLSAASRDLAISHDDTLVAGPAWADFARVMGVSDPAAKSAPAVYVLSVARALPGHREQLEKGLHEAPPKGDSVTGTALFQHLQGGNWQYLSVERYNSWQEYGATNANMQAQVMKNAGPWFQIREHMGFHRDTIAHRVAP
jgi:hypothetical protein